MIEDFIAAGSKPDAAVKAARLGRKFPKFTNNIPLLTEHRAALEQFATDNGRRPSKADSAALMESVGTRLFEQTHGRSAEDNRELWSWISAQKSRVRQPVAGQDLVFTPPKSVSTMWALADDATRHEIERIQHETVTSTLSWIEKEACFTRTGATSQEVHDTTGMVATLYNHYDSRAGDPNLHTHAVVSIKVCTEHDGKWRALDGSTLHRYAVAASQRYNAEIMAKLHTELGFDLTTRSTGRGRQDIVELAAVPQELCEMFSSRRTQIEARRDQLVADYRASHGRMPSPKAMYALYQQANLDTRAGKQEPETLREMQHNWVTRSAQILGTPEHVDGLAQHWRNIQDAHATGTLSPTTMRAADSVDVEAARVLDRLENVRASWAITHIHSAVEANFAAVTFPDDSARREAIDAVTAHVLTESVHMPAADLPPAPEVLRRRNGEFILERHGAALHTSEGVIAAEQSMLDATGTPTAYIATQAGLDKVVEKIARTSDHPLNAGQRELAEHFVGAGTLLAVGIGPAGTGKTTSMKAVTDTWTAAGYEVIALAPSAVAAETLGEEIGTTAHTLATLTYPWRGLENYEHAASPSTSRSPPGRCCSSTKHPWHRPKTSPPSPKSPQPRAQWSVYSVTRTSSTPSKPAERCDCSPKKPTHPNSPSSCASAKTPNKPRTPSPCDTATRAAWSCSTPADGSTTHRRRNERRRSHRLPRRHRRRQILDRHALHTRRRPRSEPRDPNALPRRRNRQSRTHRDPVRRTRRRSR